MTLYLAAFLAGVLTILSPCIVPVLPFALARAGQPFASGTLAFLSGLAASFAGAASLAAASGAWVADLGQAGRLAALVLLAVFAATLLSPRLSAWLHRPFVGLGERLSASARTTGGVLGSVCLGVATGLLWTPCTGPILGLILTGAALNGASWQTTALLASYAAGAATSLAAAIRFGTAIIAAIRPYLRLGDRLRQAAGAGMIAAVIAIAAGVDADLLVRLSSAGTTATEDALLKAFRIDAARSEALPPSRRSSLPIQGRPPNLDSATHWLNGEPRTFEQLRGTVVLVHVWTYSCINCIRTLPYLRAWAERYREQGLVVIGIHAPEFAFERDVGNVSAAIRRFALPYPVAVDNEFRIWRALRNSYWPALYIVDAEGRIRHHQFGEDGYAESESAIQELLAEAGGHRGGAVPETKPQAIGAEVPPDLTHLRSGETYLGTDNAQGFVSPEGLSAGRTTYTAGRPRLNQWSLTGAWSVETEFARLDAPAGGITYRFRARDLHLVLGPDPDGRPVRFTVMLDGRPPGANHGTDIAPDGRGAVEETRLYQLVRQSDSNSERTFEIYFDDPGVRAYAFTFG
ncbi:redoxin domain-containing protein [Methylobacterium trifolii]|uniref:Protein DipZ n=1 Tax=Methylobacterium trifolii TaxID=1003092 RepID=A0ABQ4TWS3_9HYPH|nr:cytochrome c biogenesis protein CcdA [Methylobacterium trifolii]GJE58433.1 Protein DipZ [Methylobacterium trifolii]